jgi:hypothetical protein
MANACQQAEMLTQEGGLRWLAFLTKLHLMWRCAHPTMLIVDLGYCSKNVFLHESVTTLKLVFVAGLVKV